MGLRTTYTSQYQNEAERRAYIEDSGDHCPYCEAWVTKTKWELHMVRNHSEVWLKDKAKRRTERARSGFDYASLSTEARIIVRQETGKIHSIMRKVANDLIEIGLSLIEVKAHLSHGCFQAWLQAEFTWSERTAQNYMRVAETFKTATVADSIPAKVLYLLASSTTPEEARTEVLEAAATGEKITKTRAQQIIDEHRKAVGKFAPEIQPTVALAAGALADTLNRPLTDGMIERTGEVIELATKTGTVAVDGASVPLTAALTLEQTEAVKRQRQHIQENNPPLANLETYVVTTHQDPGTLQKFVTFQVDDKTYTRLSEAQRAGQPVRLVVYEVNHD